MLYVCVCVYVAWRWLTMLLQLHMTSCQMICKDKNIFLTAPDDDTVQSVLDL